LFFIGASGWSWMGKFFLWLKTYWPQISWMLSGATALAGLIWRKKIVISLTAYRERRQLLAQVPTIKAQLDEMQARLDEIANELKFNGGQSTKDIVTSLHDLVELSEMRWQVQLQTTPTGVYECDPSGRCTRANPALCELFGLSESAMIGDDGNGWLQVVGRNQAEKMTAFHNWESSVREKIPYKDEYWIMPSDGEPVYCTTYAQALRSKKSGKILKFYGVVNPKPQGKRNSKDA
jgi:PAS domain S-box-containing protein